MSEPASSKPHRLTGLAPIVTWLPEYDRSWFSRDAIAAVSVWALLVPQGVAYASVAGMPPQYGLYAALFGLLLYAVFGSSRHVVTAPGATVAAVSALTAPLNSPSPGQEQDEGESQVDPSPAG